MKAHQKTKDDHYHYTRSQATNRIFSDQPQSDGWYEFKPTKPKIPWLYKRIRAQTDKAANKKAGRGDVGYTVWMEEAWANGQFPAIVHKTNDTLHERQRKAELIEVFDRLRECLDVITTFLPDPSKHHYVELSISTLESAGEVRPELVFEQWPLSGPGINQKAYVSIPFLHALARQRVPWLILQQAHLALAFLGAFDRYPARKQKDSRKSLTDMNIDVVKARASKLSDLEYIKEHKSWTDVSEKLQMDPEDEKWMNFITFKNLKNKEKTQGTYREPGTRLQDLVIPLRDFDGVIHLAISRGTEKYPLYRNVTEANDYETFWAKIWKSLPKYMESSRSGRPPRHGNFKFKPSDKPFWIEIQQAAIDRFFGEKEALEIFAECIVAVNRSKSKYEVKLGLYDGNGNLKDEMKVAEDACKCSSECQAPKNAGQKDDFIEISENPFGLYKTYIYKECLRNYFSRCAQRGDVVPVPEPLQPPRQGPNTAELLLYWLPNREQTLLKRDKQSLQHETDEVGSNLFHIRNKEGEQLQQIQDVWNPLVIQISAAKIEAAKGKRDLVVSQTTLMGSASTVAKEAFKWKNMDKLKDDGEMVDENGTAGANTEDEDEFGVDPEASDEDYETRKEMEDAAEHLQKLYEQDNELEGTQDNGLKITGGFRELYIAEVRNRR